MIGLLRTPGHEARAQCAEFLLQRSCIEPIRERALPIAIGIEVQQAHVDGIERIPFAEQVSVHLCLRPMNRSLIGWNAVNLAAMGLDFLHQSQTRVVTVGATAYRQVALLSASSAHAQLKSTDIGGFQLGQTVEQVEETLRTKYPKFQTAKVVFPGPDGKASSKVALMMAGIKDPTDSSITGNGRHPDAFSLAFSRVDGKLMHVTRYVFNRSGVVGEELRSALIEKYGPEDVWAPKPFIAPPPGTPPPAKLATYRRALTDTGQVATAPSCEAALPPAWGQRAERAAEAGCGAAVRAFWLDPVAQGVFQTYKITLYDHARNRADLEAAQADARAARDAATKRATGNAAKPAL